MNYIRYIEILINKDEWNFMSVQSLFNNIRVLLEHESKRESYPNLAFYCDWSVHSKIDRNNYLYPILENINVLLHKADVDYVEGLVKALNTERLRSELNQFLVDHNFFLIACIDEKRWNAFLLVLFETLLDKPIKYPEIEIKIKKNAIAKVNDHTKEIADRINQFEKFSNGRLDPSIDYSKTFLVDELCLQRIIQNILVCRLETFKSDGNMVEILVQIPF